MLEQVAKAPSEFTVHARNPEHDLQIGGDRMMFIPAQGPPFVRIGDERRDGTLADLVNFIKLAQMAPELDTPGGNICEPDDVPLDSRHLVQTLALIVHSDKIFKGTPMSRTASEDTIRMGEILFGGREAIEQRPMMFANVNVNSPLRYDVRMLEAMLAYSAAGQPVIVTPFLLMGAMAPVTIPSALAQQMAEVLTGIALVQLIRPGAPCVMGSFLSAIDMQSGSPSFGGPESVFGLYASGQIARRYGLPWRAGGGTLTASQSVDAQAAYESLNTLLAAFMAGANVVYQSAGWLESGLVTCFEKFALDIELLQLLRRQFTPVTFDEDALAFSAHAEIGPGGYFLGAEHTLERFRECFWRTRPGVDRELRALEAQRLPRRPRPRRRALAGGARALRAAAAGRGRARRAGASSSRADTRTGRRPVSASRRRLRWADSGMCRQVRLISSPFCGHRRRCLRGCGRG